MRVILKRGQNLVDSYYIDSQELIVNLYSKWIYKNSFYFKGRLLIQTDLGDIFLAFSRPLTKVKFDHQEKDQLIFSINLET